VADEARPLTPTSLTGDGVLGFIIKRYSDDEGVTRALHRLPPGAELLLSEPFGTISYQGTGVFIAGGAGITPFMAFLREQARAAEIDDFSQHFYVCGPPGFMQAVTGALENLGANPESLVFER
jgi:cytochrome-b5 reductase